MMIYVPKQSGHDFKNMPILSAEELAPIVDEFSAPEELIYDKGVDVGPDDILYYLHGKTTGDKYAVLCRDYMDMNAPKDETNAMRQLGVEVVRWYDVKPYNDPDGEVVVYDYLCYALAKCKIEREDEQC